MFRKVFILFLFFSPNLFLQAQTKSSSLTNEDSLKYSKSIDRSNLLYKGTSRYNGKLLENPLIYYSTDSGTVGVALYITSRSFITIPIIKDSRQLSGKVVVEIRVDKNGNVIAATAGARGTTLPNRNLWDKCENAALSSRFNPLDSAPETQIGYITFNFKQSQEAGKGYGTVDDPGEPLTSYYDSTDYGTGGVALSIAGRRFITIPKITYDGQKSGKVVVEIRVDKNGNVIAAKAGARGTTLPDRDLWDKCENAALGSRFNTLESAPETQIGYITFNFKVK